MKGLAGLMRRMKARDALILAALVIILAGFLPSLGPSLEDPMQRAARVPGPAQPSQVTIVAVDRNSIVKIGPWPWGPAVFASILDQLRLMGASLVVLDPTVAAGIDQNTLRRFATSDGARFISMGFNFYPSLARVPAEYEKTKEASERAAEALALPASPRDDSTLLSMAGVDAQTLSRGGITADGFDNILAERDGTVRRRTLAARLGHRTYPSLALGAAARAGGFTPLVSEGPRGRPTGVSIGDMGLPTRADVSMDIDFAACPSIEEAISSSAVASGEAPAEKVAGRIVLFGATEPEIADMYRTPLGRMSHAQIEACAISQLASGETFRAFTGPAWTSAAIALACLLYIGLLMNLSPAARTTYSLLLAFCAMAGGIAVCRLSGVLLPALHFGLALLIMLALSLVWNALAVERPMSRRSEFMAGRISRDLLRKAVSSPSAFDPDGRPCEIAGFASEIRGFSSIAASLDPTLLCSFLRRFRGSITKTLLENNAFLEPWSADECRASFGSIVPDKEMALAACRSAIASLHAISAAREDTSKRYGVERLSLGIGIWQGKAAAGELGPSGASNFGVTGAAMEAASSLKSLNRTYRTSVITGDEIRKSAERSFRFRPLDFIRMHGSDKPLPIYELVGEVAIIMPQLPRYLAARKAYLEGDFERACHLFAELLAEHPHDGPSQLFLNRAKSLMKSPPKAEWLGVWPG